VRAAASSGVRLAELVATISLGTDLGLGQSMEHILRQTLVSLRMAELLAFEETEREVAYFSGLLAWVGCHTDAYEQAKWFGDDIALKRDGYHYDMGRPTDVLNFAWHTVGRGRPPLERLKTWLELPLAVRRNAMVDLRNRWLAADELASRLGLGEPVRRSLKESFERWDGKGFGAARGEEIRLTSRVVCLADVVTAYYEEGGENAAVQVARQRSGTQFDPALVELFCANAAGVLSGLDGPSQWAQVIDAEPTLARVMTDPEFDAALEAIADFIDLKSPYTLGHSRSVADLAGAAARVLGLPDEDCVAVRRAGLVHDLGRLGVPNSIWDKHGPLTRSEMERVRLHPYLSERMLSSAHALAPLAAIAVEHHERMDGSGYPRGLNHASISVAGRVLGAADCYAASTEPRPHRAQLAAEEAAAALRSHVRQGRLDADAVQAVLEAAGHRTRRRRELPAGLTAREVEVLRLLTRGLSNRDIAEKLTISRKTAGSHIEHIYTKTGVRNRAGASLFAMRHGLMIE
jgi:HD-GYP domain-containing protein (c-di-GMP phosphodiesterase class II)